MVHSQSAPPPLNSNHDSTLRGMYVSCGDELILELFRNANVYDSTDCGKTPKMCGLIEFCNTRYINYVAVYSLGKKYTTGDPNPIVGNFVFFDAVKRFLQVMHDNGIKVGIVISNKEFLESQTNFGTFVTSDFFWEEPTLPWDSTCISLGKGAPNSIASGSFPDYGYLNPGPSCTIEECPAPYELAEMLKQVLRVYQYSYWVRDSTIANGCVGCTSRTSTVAPASPKYLFDYMSLEYEYWDYSTYKNADSTGITGKKGGWNAFFQISQAMIYVYGHMCNAMKMELEWRLAPADEDANRSYPANPGDLAAENMLPISMQAQYIARAFNRVLMSDYRAWDDLDYPKMINKTGNIHTKLADWPNDLNENDRHKLMPLFSAATIGEYKQCFDTLKFNTEVPPDTSEWGDDFFGKGLANGMTMFEFENLYMEQLESSITDNKRFSNNWEYKNTGSTLDTIDTLRQDIAGFMWFNYSTLKNVWRDTVAYNRQSQNQLPAELFLAQIYFNPNTAILSVKTADYEKSEAANLQLFNTEGKEVLKAKINSGRQNLSLSYLPAGAYLCRVNNGHASSNKKITIIK
ncbi:MAG: T9SS type A sorting domain-containing protein [Bacteroidetes bacterium]|nr:T9SS type A sorting domain-containing protein [Bacteroidota bacterium]